MLCHVLCIPQEYYAGRYKSYVESVDCVKTGGLGKVDTVSLSQWHIMVMKRLTWHAST